MYKVTVRLTFSQTSPGFYVSAVQAFWKHCGKRRNCCHKQFLLFSQCFLPTGITFLHFHYIFSPQCLPPLWRTFCHFCPIWNCRMQTLSVWKSLKFVVWERVILTSPEHILLGNWSVKMPQTGTSQRRRWILWLDKVSLAVYSYKGRITVGENIICLHR